MCLSLSLSQQQRALLRFVTSRIGIWHLKTGYRWFRVNTNTVGILDRKYKLDDGIAGPTGIRSKTTTCRLRLISTGTATATATATATSTSSQSNTYQQHLTMSRMSSSPSSPFLSLIFPTSNSPNSPHNNQRTLRRWKRNPLQQTPIRASYSLHNLDFPHHACAAPRRDPRCRLLLRDDGGIRGDD